MTRENNGKKKWVKHHLIEFNEVDLSDVEQLKKVCHYTNIIPMWEDEHIALHSKNPKRRKKISPTNN
jgi:transcription termination factor Rho